MASGRPASGVGQQFSAVADGQFDCIWCLDWRTKNKNNSRRKTHLLKCNPFLQAVGAGVDIGTFDDNFQARSRGKLGLGTENNEGAAAAQIGKHELDKLAAMTIYRGGLPFHLYQQNSDLLKLLKALNPQLKYTPPGRARLAGELLTECSDDIAAEVKAIVNGEEWINVITDESGAKNHDRVVNLSVNTAAGQAFFIESFNAGANVVGEDWLRDTITEKVSQLADGDLTKWNSSAPTPAIVSELFIVLCKSSLLLRMCLPFFVTIMGYNWPQRTFVT
jgi:hypothetical protein